MTNHLHHRAPLPSVFGYVYLKEKLELPTDRLHQLQATLLLQKILFGEDCKELMAMKHLQDC